MVTLKYFGELQELTKVSTEEIEANNIKAVLGYINRTYGKEVGNLAKSSLITLNDGRVTHPKTICPSNSIIRFHPFCSGG